MQPLDCANLATDWPRWKQQFKIHLVATEKHNQPENNKIATFLWLIGDRGLQVFNSIFPDTDVLSETPTSETSPGSKKDAVTLSKVLEAFDSHCLPRKNIAMEAFKLNLISQQEGQPFSEFETALRSQIQHCDYNCSRCKLSYADRMMRDRVIIGVNNKDLQLKLLDRKEESLARSLKRQKLTSVCWSPEQRESKLMRSTDHHRGVQRNQSSPSFQNVLIVESRTTIVIVPFAPQVV